MPIPALSPPPASHAADHIPQPTVFGPGAASAKQARGQQQAERQIQRQRERDTERRPQTPFPARPILPDVPDVPAGTESTASTAGSGSGSRSSRDGRNGSPGERKCTAGVRTAMRTAMRTATATRQRQRQRQRHQRHQRQHQWKLAPKPLSHVRTITPAVPWRREHPDLFHARPPAAAADEERSGGSGSRLRFRETYRAGPPGEGRVFWGLVEGLGEGWREKRERGRLDAEGEMDVERGGGERREREPKSGVAWPEATMPRPRPESELRTHEHGDIALRVFENYQRGRQVRAESGMVVPLKISRSMQAEVPMDQVLSRERKSQARRQTPVRPHRSPVERVTRSVPQQVPARPPAPFRGRPPQEQEAPVSFLERLHIWKPVSDGPFSAGPNKKGKERDKSMPWDIDPVEQKKNKRKLKISDSQSPLHTRSAARSGRAGESAAAFGSSVQAPVPESAMKQPPQSKSPNVFNIAHKQDYNPDRGTVFSDFMHLSEISKSFLHRFHTNSKRRSSDFSFACQGVDTPPISPGSSNFIRRGKSMSKKQYRRTRSSFYCQGVPNEPEPLRKMEGLGNTRHYSNPGNPFVGFERRQRTAESGVSPDRGCGQHKPSRKEWWEFDSDEDEVPLSPLSHNRNVNGKNGNSLAQGGYEAAQYVTRARDSEFYGPYHDILDDYGQSTGGGEIRRFDALQIVHRRRSTD